MGGSGAGGSGAGGLGAGGSTTGSVGELIRLFTISKNDWLELVSFSFISSHLEIFIQVK